MPSVVNSSPLIFSPLFLFFSCAIAYLSQCDMQTSFPGLFGLLSTHLRLCNSSWSTFAHFKLSKNIKTCHLQRVLEYGLLYKEFSFAVNE